VCSPEPVRDTPAATASRELSRPQREQRVGLRVDAAGKLAVQFDAAPSGDYTDAQVPGWHLG
jgi:hypothetical protein